MIIAFTGHRPDKLGGYNWTNPINKAIMSLTYDTVKGIIGKDPATVICGGALGFDQFAFQAMASLRSRYNPNLTLEVAVPFKLQYSKWLRESQNTYFKQLDKADVVTYVDTLPRYALPNTAPDVYTVAKMQKRNEYMVDKADLVIACWNGTSGGTANCVRYAQRMRKPVLNIWDSMH